MGQANPDTPDVWRMRHSYRIREVEPDALSTAATVSVKMGQWQAETPDVWRTRHSCRISEVDPWRSDCGYITHKSVPYEAAFIVCGARAITQEP
ncbi:hypothetical protein D3C72_1697560 [compost metagenome]